MKQEYLKRFLIFSLLTMLTMASYAQKKILKKLFSNEKDTTRSSSFLPLPAVAYAQETGLEFGLVTLYSFYTDREDTLTRNSSITGVGTFTTEKQIKLQLKTDIWAPQNRYHYANEIRFRDFPFNFYGIGNRTQEANLANVTQRLLRVVAEVEKKFGQNSYTGLAASFENHQYSYTEKMNILPVPQPFLFGRDGGKVLYVGLSQIIDSRNNNTYTTSGTFIKINYSYAPDIFGGENFSGSLTELDLRIFKTVNPVTVFAFNANYQSLQGNRAPFYLMPQLGNDQMMRGYYQGRFRDQNLLAAQAEFRYRFHPRLGLVGFAGTGTVYNNGNLNFRGLKPSLGGGFRYFFDVERGLSIRLDYAVGEKRPMEKRQSGFYISLGEAF